MAIVWVMEDPGQGLAQLTRALIGNFAVRCIASEKSLRFIVKMESESLPQLLAINLDHFTSESEDFLKVISQMMPSTTIVGFNQGAYLREQLSPRCHRFQEQDVANLVRFVREALVATDRGSKDLVFYRDIQLNLADFSYRIQPNERFDSLSNLEFKLMRLFLKNPRKCFERQELIDHIWDKMKVASRTVDSQISRLRKRIQDSECEIESVYGGGYRLI